jgi:hypothetical protein
MLRQHQNENLKLFITSMLHKRPHSTNMKRIYRPTETFNPKKPHDFHGAL